MISFYIDNNEINLDDSSLLKNEIEIKSEPENYKISWYFNETPISLIEDKFLSGDLLFVDKNVYNIYFKNKINIEISKIYLFDALEENKNINSVLDFCSFLSKNNVNKGNKIFVIGGGITQDVAGFACNIYKRGIKWHFFPTTLLSMSDSCIGGKTGLNFDDSKNQLALFANPKQIYVCLDFLNSLSDVDICSGLGEILKLFAIASKNYISEFNEKIKTKEIEKYLELSKKAILIKKSIIEKDPFEANIRKSLNYGHTIGHAIESASNYEISHGESVVIGMLIVNSIFKNEEKDLKDSCLNLVNIEKIKNIDFKNLTKLIKKDKKTINDEIVFVVLENCGNIVFKKSLINEELQEKIIFSINKLLEK